MHMLENSEETQTLGKAGQELVRNNFLMPELLRKYLVLLRFYSGAEASIPEFRLNELTYSELFHSMRRQHPQLTP